MTSELINQGGYGCIYYPSLPIQFSKRNKNIQSSKKYISKLQKKNFHSEFEDFIGKVIQDIPCYELFFVPVLKTYKIDLATIKEGSLRECDAISKYIKHNKSTDKRPHKSQSSSDPIDYKLLNDTFIIQKMDYIDSTDIHKHLNKLIDYTKEKHKHESSTYKDKRDSDSDSVSSVSSVSTSDSINSIDGGIDGGIDDISPEKSIRKAEYQIRKYKKIFNKDTKKLSYHLMSIIFDLYERITDSVQLLIKYKIVHYDLKENNILINNTTHLPVLIDFGLSIYVKRLIDNPWKETNEKSETIDSDVMYRDKTVEVTQNNYYWKQHFYVHAPEYYLWPMEVHIITFLINENEIMTEEDLATMAYTFTLNNRAIDYTSIDFKMKYMELCIDTFSQYVNKPREHVINELSKYWDKWDMYANNIMFIKLFYGMVMDTHRRPSRTKLHTEHSHKSRSRTQDSKRRSSISTSQHRQDTLEESHSHLDIKFNEDYQIQLKPKYVLNNNKIIDIIKIMMWNIHPNPNKRLTPEATKAVFNGAFYEC